MVNRTFLGQFQDLNALECVTAQLGLTPSLNQISRGVLSSTLIAANLGPLRLLQIDFNQAMAIRGSKPPGCFLFAMTLAETGGMLKTHGKSTPQDYLYGCSPCYDVHLLTPQRFNFVLIIVNQDYFLQFLQRIGHASLGDRLQTMNWLQVNTDFFEPLKDYVREIFYVIAHQPDFLMDSDPGSHSETPRQSLIIENLFPLLAECLSAGHSRLKTFEARDSRVLLVKQAEALMSENLEKPITLTDIYQLLHTSRRTLIYAFKDVVGMTPMAYIKTLRLNAVRRSLLAAYPDEITVSFVAQQYGFWSAGHFARDYYNLFGESPSQTLQGR